MATTREREFRERIAMIEGTGRAVNEEIVRRWGHLNEDGREYFRCECGIDACQEFLRLPVGVYERARRDPLLFIVRPGHDVPGVEEVVEEGDGYAIVRKSEDVRDIVESTDPRRAR